MATSTQELLSDQNPEVIKMLDQKLEVDTAMYGLDTQIHDSMSTSPSSTVSSLNETDFMTDLSESLYLTSSYHEPILPLEDFSQTVEFLKFFTNDSNDIHTTDSQDSTQLEMESMVEHQQVEPEASETEEDMTGHIKVSYKQKVKFQADLDLLEMERLVMLKENEALNSKLAKIKAICQTLKFIVAAKDEEVKRTLALKSRRLPLLDFSTNPHHQYKQQLTNDNNGGKNCNPLTSKSGTVIYREVTKYDDRANNKPDLSNLNCPDDDLPLLLPQTNSFNKNLQRNTNENDDDDDIPLITKVNSTSTTSSNEEDDENIYNLSMNSFALPPLNHHTNNRSLQT